MQIFECIHPVVAYFDPGSGSLVLQAIVGGAAGLVVLVRYLWESLPVPRGKRETTDEAGAS
jgi:hypothetical protein